MQVLQERSYRTRSVIRTIRNGKVKVFGHWFSPREEYHGELDGQRWAFGIYYIGNMMMDTLYLWGSEDLYHAINDENFSELYYSQDNIRDGVIHWSWWDNV